MATFKEWKNHVESMSDQEFEIFRNGILGIAVSDFAIEQLFGTHWAWESLGHIIDDERRNRKKAA